MAGQALVVESLEKESHGIEEILGHGEAFCLFVLYAKLSSVVVASPLSSACWHRSFMDNTEASDRNKRENGNYIALESSKRV
jgi:hypothetical protein